MTNESEPSHRARPFCSRPLDGMVPNIVDFATNILRLLYIGGSYYAACLWTCSRFSPPL
jgi:hypothetical protein